MPHLVNPAEIVHWNTDQCYFADLGLAGAPIVATSWLAPGDPINFPTSRRHVLKPAVGAGSLDAAAYALEDPFEAAPARDHAARPLAPPARP